MVVDVDDPSVVQTLSRGFFGCYNGEAFCCVGANLLVVVFPQGTVTDHASVREDKLAESIDVQSEAFDFSFVALEHFVFLFFTIGHIFPSVLVSVHIHIRRSRKRIRTIVVRGFVLFDVLNEFLIFRSKVIEWIQFFPKSFFVPKLAMLFVDHMLLTTLPCRENLVTVETIVTQFDFLVAIAQKSFQIGKAFFVGDKEPIFLLHIVNVFLETLGFVLVEQTLFWVDFRVFLALRQGSRNSWFWRFALIFCSHFGVGSSRRGGSTLLVGFAGCAVFFFTLFLEFLLALFAVDVFEMIRSVLLFFFLSKCQGSFQSHLEFFFFQKWKPSLAAFQVVLVPVTLVMLGNFASGSESLSRSGSRCQCHSRFLSVSVVRLVLNGTWLSGKFCCYEFVTVLEEANSAAFGSGGTVYEHFNRSIVLPCRSTVLCSSAWRSCGSV
mmetsp:Transcript_5978/g.17001  ORF Transcript_5978/g.17001 Transcript_5978/m.17001 type:complete len:436 (-) Transcript_5978:59-1366(-)